MSHGFTKEYLAIPSARSLGSTGQQTNLSAGNRLGGTTVAAAGSTHTKGSYATLFTANADVFGLVLRVGNIAASTVARGALMDIAYGGSDTIVVPDLNVGYASYSLGGGKEFFLPGLNIPSGEDIKARIQCATASVNSVVSGYTIPRMRFDSPNTTYIAYGVDTGTSQGVAITPGNGTFGSWVEIDTTSRDHYVWLPGIDMNASASLTTADGLLEVGYGPDNLSITTMGFANWSCGASETLSTWCVPIFYFVPSGEKLWARAASGNTNTIAVTMHGN